MKGRVSCVLACVRGTTSIGRLVDLSRRLVGLFVSVPAPLTSMIMAHQEAKWQQHREAATGYLLDGVLLGSPVSFELSYRNLSG